MPNNPFRVLYVYIPIVLYVCTPVVLYVCTPIVLYVYTPNVLYVYTHIAPLIKEFLGKSLGSAEIHLNLGIWETFEQNVSIIGAVV